jgi:TfoX/Sxy family transcriptional regulator of competence genes
MAYDETLAERTRTVLAGRDGVTEQKMFGGIAFMVADHMAVGVINDDLMVRVGPDAHDDAVSRPHVRPMEFGSRTMRGMVSVGPAGTADDRDLARWVDAGASFAGAQPPKKKPAKRTKAG